MKQLDLPYEYIEVFGGDAEGKLRELKKEGQASGFFPVLIGDEDDAMLLIENFEDFDQTPEEIIEASSKIQLPNWFDERKEEDPEQYEVEEGDRTSSEGESGSLEVPFQIGKNIAKNSVYIVKIPTTKSWEVPAYLKAGGWNECPSPEEHVAVLKYWNAKYGAEVASLTGDTFEMFVENPPIKFEDTADLGMEQFIYCSDIVHQGVETMNGLRASLVRNTVWFFWWD